VLKLFWWGKADGKRSLERPERRWIILRDEGMDWIDLPEGRDRWRVINFW
jgi:hypothetical protein